ncbi:hypothetical protein JHK87_004770 [Glycine soja]|nr:hypothetical protein JHK87_004770 [Glycine soja]
MKFGWDVRTGPNKKLIAWKSLDDPSPSDFSFGMVLNNYPEAYMMNGDQKFYRSGPWNGLHSSDSPVCQCLQRFKPKLPEACSSMGWSHGCICNKELSCENKNKDKFNKLTLLKTPDTTHSWLDQTIGLEECKAKCLDNCSCMAYVNLDISGQGSGCAMWFGDLIDIRQFAIGGQDVYVQIDASKLGRNLALQLIISLSSNKCFS